MFEKEILNFEYSENCLYRNLLKLFIKDGNFFFNFGFFLIFRDYVLNKFRSFIYKKKIDIVGLLVFEKKYIFKIYIILIICIMFLNYIVFK